MFLNIFMGAIMVLSMIVSVVLWFMALVGAITRKDLKESKVLWIVLLLFIGPIGVIAYFFVENRKKLGIMSIVVYAIMLIVLPLYGITKYVTMLKYQEAQTKAYEASQATILEQTGQVGNN